jgi:hypothetical protein
MLLNTHREETLEKPDGGYVSISTLTLGLLWWAFSEGLLSLRAVRVGLALFEVRLRRLAYVRTERKAGRRPEFTPRFSVSELASLCGLPEARARAALRELIELGLLAEFSETSIRFARSLSEVRLSPEQLSAFRSWLGVLTKRQRVPIPRRVLILACESSSRALIAVILGGCLRCSWLRPGDGFSFLGRVPCSWLARRFRLSVRAVQTAKAHLSEIGWLTLSGDITTSGELVSINPHWHRLSAVEDGNTQAEGVGKGPSPAPAVTNSAGVEASSDTNSAGVSSYESPSLREHKNQDERESPGAKAPENPCPGVFEKPSKKTQASLPPPRLSNIRPEDLRLTERLIGQGGLFAQAVKAGVLSDCEADLLYFVACAERARTVEVRDPCGAFNALMKNRRRFVAFISGEQEDSARCRIREWRNSESPGGVSFFVPSIQSQLLPAEPPRPRFSKDAELVRILREKLGTKGTSIFAALKSHASWDYPRYSAALAELDAAGPGAAC